MKHQLQKRFSDLMNLYNECTTNVERYLSSQEHPDFSQETTSQAMQKQISEEYLYNASLKKNLDDLLHQIKGELSKPETDINYAAYSEKITIAENFLHELNNNIKPTWKKVSDSFFFQLLIVFLLKTFIFGWYCVPTGSAEVNLLVGDRILCNKTAYWFNPVKRGDLAVFDNPEKPYSKDKLTYLWQRFVGIEVPFLGLPEGPDNFVKRVIALPGDIVEGKIEDGKPTVYVNGNKLEESTYVNPYPLIAVQKMNGFFSPKTGIGKVLNSIQQSPALRTVFGLSVGATFYLGSFDLGIGRELSAAAISVVGMIGAKFLKVFITRKSDNCGGYPSWYSYDAEKSYADQPFYKLEAQEVIKNPVTGEPYLKNAGEPDSYDTFRRMRVPEGMYWLQGDSRRNSRDCRAWGFVDGSLIRGRASVIVYSINSEEIWWLFDILQNPLTFWSKRLRPERSFTMLRNPLPESAQL